MAETPREKKKRHQISPADIEFLGRNLRSAGVRSGYFMVGPTASGKTDVAHYLADLTEYSVLSADSMAVYRQMDIGTAKPDSEQLREVRYYGLDLTDPCELFSVGQYLRYVQDIDSDAGLIVAGGTGLYVKALIEGIEFVPEIDPKRRRFWNRFYSQYGIKELGMELKRRNPAVFSRIDDPHNPRRLIRALEILEMGGTPPFARRAGSDEHSTTGQTGDGVLVGLRIDREERKRRIERRVEDMYSQGLIEETKRILDSFGEFSRTAGKAIGYSEALEHIAGRLTLDEAKERTAVRTRQLAKRQMTWFRRQLKIDWVDVVSGRTDIDIAAEVVRKWLRHGPAAVAGSIHGKG